MPIWVPPTKNKKQYKNTNTISQKQVQHKETLNAHKTNYTVTHRKLYKVCLKVVQWVIDKMSKGMEVYQKILFMKNE